MNTVKELKKQRIQLPTGPETNLNLAFAYNYVRLCKLLVVPVTRKVKWEITLSAEQGNIVIIRDGCKILRHAIIIFTYVLFSVSKRRFFSVEKKKKEIRKCLLAVPSVKICSLNSGICIY